MNIRIANCPERYSVQIPDSAEDAEAAERKFRCYLTQQDFSVETNLDTTPATARCIHELNGTCRAINLRSRFSTSV